MGEVGSMLGSLGQRWDLEMMFAGFSESSRKNFPKSSRAQVNNPGLSRQISRTRISPLAYDMKTIGQ